MANYFNAFTASVFFGNGFLAVCCMFYLLWWLIAFKPGANSSKLKKAVPLVAAASTGAVGLALIVSGIGVAEKATVSAKYFLCAGAALYVLLLAVTLFVFKRKVTVELLLIVGWTTLELCIVDRMYSGGYMGAEVACVFSGIIAFALIASMICYVLYYRVEKQRGYIVGTLPLIAEAIVSAAVAAACI